MRIAWLRRHHMFVALEWHCFQHCPPTFCHVALQHFVIFLLRVICSSNMTANSTIMKLSPNLLLDCVELLLSFLLKQGWTLHYNLFFLVLDWKASSASLVFFPLNEVDKKGKTPLFCSDQRKWETLVYTTYFFTWNVHFEENNKGFFWALLPYKYITHSNELGLTIQQTKILVSSKQVETCKIQKNNTPGPLQREHIYWLLNIFCCFDNFWSDLVFCTPVSVILNPES